jgi:hypothetical protein
VASPEAKARGPVRSRHCFEMIANQGGEQLRGREGHLCDSDSETGPAFFMNRSGPAPGFHSQLNIITASYLTRLDTFRRQT